MKILDVPQSGSVGGVTSSRNRAGQYRRTRAIPVNPNSAAQVSARSRFTSQATAWATLTDVQRAAWDVYGNAHPKTDSLGQSVPLTGFQAYVGVNSFLTSVGTAAIAEPPVTDDVGLISALALTIEDGSGTFEVGLATEVATQKVAIFVSAPVSAGVGFMADYRLLKVATAVANVIAEDVYSDYTSKFGLLPAGKKVFVKCVPYNVTGARGPALVGSGIVQA